MHVVTGSQRYVPVLGYFLLSKDTTIVFRGEVRDPMCCYLLKVEIFLTILDGSSPG